MRFLWQHEGRGQAGVAYGLSPLATTIATARAAGATGKILVRGDSAYGNGNVVRACRRAKVEFSLVLTKNRVV